MKFIKNENIKDKLENVDAVESKENKSKVVDMSHDDNDEVSDGKIYVKNECFENPEDVKENIQVEEEETEVIDENLDELDLEKDDSCKDHKEVVDPDDGCKN